MKKIIKHTLDLSRPPSLTRAQKLELKTLAAMTDSDIDYSDISPLDDTFWKMATRGSFYKPTKQSTTIRVDSDVLAWLKNQGKGYQTKINAILRESMLRAQPSVA